MSGDVYFWRTVSWGGACWFSFFFFCKGEVETATGVLFFISAVMKQLFALIGCVQKEVSRTAECIAASGWLSRNLLQCVQHSSALLNHSGITTAFTSWGKKPPFTANYKLIYMLARTNKCSWPPSPAIGLFKIISPFLVFKKRFLNIWKEKSVDKIPFQVQVMLLKTSE